MNQKATTQCHAFTRVELVLVIVVLIVLGSMIVPAQRPLKAKAQRIYCVGNLREIGEAYRLWTADGDQWPAMNWKTNGGWADLLTNANRGGICWTNYALIVKEVTNLSPKIFVCPVDDRKAATDFKTSFRDNFHLSYFVGVSASDVYPHSILGGDRNLGAGSVPEPDYGYSPTKGRGNDVAVPLSGPVLWSLKMHSAGNTAGAGNILLGDGSAQQTSSHSLNANWLSNSPPTTNWPAGHVPAVPSIRLVFP